MTKITLHYFCLLLIPIMLSFYFILNCSQKSTQSSKIHVIASIAPLAEFAERVGSEKINVSVMIPSGSSAHTYEPTPNQLVNVGNADMYIKVGTPIEFEMAWLNKILKMKNGLYVVDASKSIELISTAHSHHDDDINSEPLQNHTTTSNESDHNIIEQKTNPDPHIWLSPINAQIMVENIYEGLIAIDPAHAAFYEKNKNTYIDELKTLHQEIINSVAGSTNNKFMVYHPAWGYFADTYQLEQISIEEEGKEPTAKDIQRIINRAKQERIKTIFASPQFNIRSAQLIANEIDGQVILINPMEKDYLGNMRNLIQQMSDDLK